MSNNCMQEAFIYGYPIMGMYELLYQQVNSLGFHRFAHERALATPKTTFVPAPNNDTTYSRAWLDLRKGPLVIEVPDTEERFYSIQLLDMFSETIANVGKRTTGTKALRFILTGPNYQRDVPNDSLHIKCSTNFVLAFLRILIHNESDLPAVKALQERITISPLTSQDGFASARPLPEYKNTNFRMYFETLSKILPAIAPPCHESKIVEEINRCSKISDSLLKEDCSFALMRIEEGGLQFGESVNFWRIARKGIGNYGNDYLQRAVVWHKGALANSPKESLYPSTFQDDEGNYLSGENKYILFFPAGSLPPVSQFWSLTMYRFSDAFLTENSINRYSIGDRTENIVYKQDNSLTIYISHEKPDTEEKTANWLPAPKERFYMTLRLYGPDQSAIDGDWAPPGVKKIK